MIVVLVETDDQGVAVVSRETLTFARDLGARADGGLGPGPKGDASAGTAEVQLGRRSPTRRRTAGERHHSPPPTAPAAPAEAGAAQS